MRTKKIFVFIGPTSFGISLNSLLPPETIVFPPVRRGDIEALIETENPATIVVVDGTYHAYPAVSHVEIKDALRKKWQVWGMSSMGAIRAAEMYELGMQGYGSVYQRFVNDAELPDDYVALVHGAESPWIPISEPLIHIERLLEDALNQSIITPAINRILMDDLQNMWFGYRTLTYIKEKTNLLLDGKNEKLCEILNNIEQYRIKSHDFNNFFIEKPFLRDRG